MRAEKFQLVKATKLGTHTSQIQATIQETEARAKELRVRIEENVAALQKLRSHIAQRQKDLGMDEQGAELVKTLEARAFIFSHTFHLQFLFLANPFFNANLHLEPPGGGNGISQDQH